jgi:hypothetical protein
LQNAEEFIYCDLWAAVDVANEVALGHSCDYDVAVAAAAQRLRGREVGWGGWGGGGCIRVLFILGEVTCDGCVEDARAARAHRVTHFHPRGDESHAGGVDAGAAHAAIHLNTRAALGGGQNGKTVV